MAEYAETLVMAEKPVSRASPRTGQAAFETRSGEWPRPAPGRRRCHAAGNQAEACATGKSSCHGRTRLRDGSHAAERRRETAQAKPIALHGTGAKIARAEITSARFHGVSRQGLLAVEAMAQPSQPARGRRGPGRSPAASRPDRPGRSRRRRGFWASMPPVS